MPSPRVRKHMPILEYINSMNEKERKHFLKGANIELLKTLSEICLNLLAGTIKIPPSELQKLKRFKKEIITLSEKRHSLKKRVKICQKGGFIGSLLALAIPSIVQAIISAVKK